MFGAPNLGKKSTPYAYKINQSKTTYRAVGHYETLQAANKEGNHRLKIGNIKSYRVDKIGGLYLLNVIPRINKKGYLTNSAADVRELY